MRISMIDHVQKLQGHHHREFFAGCKQKGIKELRYHLFDSHISSRSCKVLYFIWSSVKCEIRKFSFVLSFFLTTQTNPRPLGLPLSPSHLYSTHISRNTMFPNFRSPEGWDTGINASSHQPFHPSISSKAFDMVGLRRTRDKRKLLVYPLFLKLT